VKIRSFFLSGLAILFLCGSPVTYADEVRNLKPEAKVFFHYRLDLTSSGDIENFTDRGNEFDFSRVYAGLKYRMSEDFLAHFLTDVGRRDNTGQLEVFAKYAYLDWSLGFAGAHLTMGLQTTYNWKQPETMWGYRGIQYAPMEAFHKYWSSEANIYLSSLSDSTAEVFRQASNFTIASGNGMGSSADLGIGFSIKPGGSYYLNLLIHNGPGYKSAENDFYKNIQVRTGRYFLDKSLHVTGYAEVEPWKGAEKTYVNLQWDLAASYEKEDLFLAGINANGKTFPGSMETITGWCVSGFGSVFIVKKRLKVLGRYDYFITGLDDNTNAGLMIAGIDYIPLKGINIVPNVQVWDYEDSRKDTQVELYVHVLYAY
jgi:hypothetical protein